MIPRAIQTQVVLCGNCREEHVVAGAPGQTVTIDVRCACGTRVRFTYTFPGRA